MSELRTVIPYLRPYRRGIALGLVCVALANAFQIAGPYLMKLAIDGLDDPGVTHGRILLYAGLIVGAALLGGAARYGMRELLNGISRKIERDLRSDFFSHLLRLDASYYGDVRTGDLMSRATNDIFAVRQAVGPAIMYSVNTTVTFAFALSLMLWISPRLTAVAVVPMVLLPPVVLGFGRVIHERFQRIQEHFATLSTMVQESLSGVRVIRAYVREEDRAADFAGLNDEYLERNMHLAKAQAAFHPILTTLAGLGMVIVLWQGGIAIIEGEITVGDFVAFGFYLGLLTWPMIALGWVINLFQRGAASMERVNRVLGREPRIEAPEAPAVLGDVRGEVEFRDVSFRYPGTERPILRGISFRVRPGETVAIVGPTGSGKTTLVSLLPRIHDPTGGEVLVDGVPAREADPAELREVIGMVPQDTFLFSDTIASNIALGLREGAVPGPEAGEGPEAGGEAAPDDAGEVPDVVVRSSRIAHLHGTIEDFPAGYRTYLGERGINLSGGQKQRAALARAIARDPAILVLDDALSAVDTRTERRILRELEAVMEGRTAFIISHRMSAVMHADQILVLEGGEIVERGVHDDLIAAGGTYARLLRRQMLEEDLEALEAAAAGAGAPGAPAD